PGLGYKRVVSCKDSSHGTDVLAVSEHGAPGTAPEHPRALRRSPKGGRPRYTAGPRRRGKPKHSHRGHPVPGPWKRRSQAVRERKTSVLRACRVPNLAKRLNVVQRPKTLFEPQRSMTGVAADRPRRRHDLGARAAHSGPGTPQATGVATPTDARSASPTPTRLR